MSLPELVLPPAVAALVAHGHVTVLGDQPAFTVPCETCGGLGMQPIGRDHSRLVPCGWPSCTDGSRPYSGPVTLRAGTELPEGRVTIGEWTVWRLHGRVWLDHPDIHPMIRVRPGVIVGTADIEQVPIVQFHSRAPGHHPEPPWTPHDGDKHPYPLVGLNSDASRLTLYRAGQAIDISDQIAYSTFTPGGTATVFTNARPT